MALSIAGKDKKGRGAKAAAPKTTAAAGGAKKLSWLLRGPDAKAAAVKEEARADARREAADRLFRFRLDVGGSTTITFLDGETIADGEEKGMLDIVYFYEHEVWGHARRGPSHFVCPKEMQGDDCPLCEIDNHPYYAGALTVVDHSGFDKRDGTHVPYTRQLFIAKSQTLTKLQVAAGKRGGSLVGWHVDVSRSDQRSARVGDDFDWEGNDDLETIAAEFPEADVLTPTDYERELPYRTGEELGTMGFQEAAAATGSNGSGQSPAAKGGAPF